MSEEFVLKTEDLTKHYGGVRALEGANFQLKKGEHVAIMGDNAAQACSVTVRRIVMPASTRQRHSRSKNSRPDGYSFGNRIT